MLKFLKTVFARNFGTESWIQAQFEPLSTRHQPYLFLTMSTKNQIHSSPSKVTCTWIIDNFYLSPTTNSPSFAFSDTKHYFHMFLYPNNLTTMPWGNLNYTTIVLALYGDCGEIDVQYQISILNADGEKCNVQGIYSFLNICIF